MDTLLIEQAVLGCMIMEQKTTEIVLKNYNENYFTTTKTKKLYTIIDQFYKNNKTIDETILVANLEKDMEMNMFVRDCIAQVSHLDFFDRYLEELKENKLKRDIKNIGIEIQNIDNFNFKELLDISVKKISELQPIEIKNKKQKLDDIIIEYENLLKRGNEMNSGFPSFDKLVHGFRRNRVYVLGGEPGAGKTGLALNFACRVAFEQNKKVLFFSLEMPEFDIVGRLASLIGNIPSWRVQQPWLMQPDDFIKLSNTCAKIYKSNLEFEYGCLWNITKIIAQIKQVNPDIVFIDHLQYIPLIIDKNEKQHDALNKIIRQLKDIAEKQNCCIFALSHMKKNSTGSTNEDEFKNSAGIREAIDIGMIIKKEKKKNGIGTKPEGYRKLYINKNRNGIEGYVPLLFIAENLKYGEYSEFEI